MGWSCRADASRAMERLEAACRRSTGSQNVFLAGGRQFFWEIDREEYDDGRITGQWFVFVGKNACEEMGRWTIDPNGTEMIGGHKWMRDRVAES